MQKYRTSIIVALSYFAAALAALKLSEGVDGAATIWAPSGIILAAFILRPRTEYGQILVALFVASMASNIAGGSTLALSFHFTVANLLEGVVGMALVRFFKLEKLSFDDPLRAACFAAAALVSSAASTLSVAVLTLIWDVTFVASWFFTVLLGQLIFAPVFVTTFRRKRAHAARGGHTTRVDVGLIVAINVMVSVLAFFQTGMPLLFVPVLPILLATYYLGPAGAALGVACTAIIGSVATLNGLGPAALLSSTVLTPTQFFQVYLVFLLTAALPLASALAARNASYQETSRQKRYFELASQTAQIGHWRLDLETQRLSWSDEVFRIYGMPVGEVPSLEDAIAAYHPEDQAFVEKWVSQAAETGQEFAFDARITTAQGRLRYVNSRGQAEVDANGDVIAIFGVFQDVTDRVQLAQDLAAAKEIADNRAEQANILAGTDQLTSVPNRRGILARLSREMEQADALGSALTVAMLDIDHFKSINDKFGHATGDEVLKRVASICVDVLRDSDGFGRLGGEEFLIVLPGATSEAAFNINERLCKAIRETTAMMINLPATTVSIGIASYETGMSSEALLATADGALYKAKREGRDLVLVA